MRILSVVFCKTAIAKAALALFFCFWALNAAAGDVTPPALSDEEAVAGACIIANQGAYVAMRARQDGVPYDDAKAQLDRDFALLGRSLSNEKFLQGVRSAWSYALEAAYAQKPQLNPDAKQEAVTLFVAQGLRSCMQELNF